MKHFDFKTSDKYIESRRTGNNLYATTERPYDNIQNTCTNAYDQVNIQSSAPYPNPNSPSMPIQNTVLPVMNADNPFPLPTLVAPLSAPMLSQKEIEKATMENELQRIVHTCQQAMPNMPAYGAPIRCVSHPTVPQTMVEALEYIACGTQFSNNDLIYALLNAILIATPKEIRITLDEHWFEATALNTLLVSDSGMKKTKIINLLRQPFDDYDQAIDEKNVASDFARDSMQKYNKRIEKEVQNELLKSLAKKMPHEQKMALINESVKKIKQESLVLQKSRSSLIDSCTPSGILDYLAEQNEQGGSITAEGDILEALLFNKNADPYLFNKLYNQEPYNKRTGRKAIDLTSPRFSFLAFTQSDIAAKVYNDDNLHNLGVTARILPVYCSSYQHRGIISNDKGYKCYVEKIKNLLGSSFSGKKGSWYNIKVTPLAYSYIKSFEHENMEKCQNMLPEQTTFVRKLHGHAVRLAWAIHIWQQTNYYDTPIDEDEMMQAIDLSRALRDNAYWFYDPSMLRARANAIKIWENLKQINIVLGSETIARGYTDSRTIQQRTHLKAKDVANALTYLQNCSFINIIDHGSRHNIVVLHPHFKNCKVL